MRTVHILITPDGRILAFRNASTALLRQSEFGGKLHELSFQDDKIAPIHLPEYGPSGVRKFGKTARRGF
ncbi:MAG: hypothetical protein JST16_14415 [Bdellovibrionales bacterium]|nr:hypothetical protein [Bdellovibrionales bacterium]